MLTESYMIRQFIHDLQNLRRDILDIGIDCPTNFPYLRLINRINELSEDYFMRLGQVRSDELREDFDKVIDCIKEDIGVED